MGDNCYLHKFLPSLHQDSNGKDVEESSNYYNNYLYCEKTNKLPSVTDTRDDLECRRTWIIELGPITCT